MECMNEHIAAADESIADIIDSLCTELKRDRFLSDKDEIIDRIAKLRASMNPTIIQKIQQ